MNGVGICFSWYDKGCIQSLCTCVDTETLPNCNFFYSSISNGFTQDTYQYWRDSPC